MNSIAGRTVSTKELLIHTLSRITDETIEKNLVYFLNLNRILFTFCRADTLVNFQQKNLFTKEKNNERKQNQGT